MDTEPGDYQKLADMVLSRLSVTAIDNMAKQIREEPGKPIANMTALLSLLTHQRTMLAGEPASAPALPIPSWAELV